MSDSIYWQEDEEEEFFTIPERIVDLAFTMECRMLPLDHGHALHQAIVRELPWIDDEPAAAIQHIFPADSGNGWISPEEAGEAFFYPSRRTRLVLRLPAERVEEAHALIGQTLDIQGYPITIKKADRRPLSAETTLYARYVVDEAGEGEEPFLRQVVTELRGLGVAFKKLVCGMTHTIETPDGPLHTRSVMLADLSRHDAVKLQEEGLGRHKKLGCGIFLPHKSVKK